MRSRRFSKTSRAAAWALLGLAACLVVGWTSPTALGQGVLIAPDSGRPFPLPRPWPHPRPPRPAPPASYKIDELTVNARILDQLARIEVSQTFVNTGSRPMEARFVFPLPYDGAVDRLTFMVDGREIEAKLLPAEEARRIYEGYMRRNQDPALLEWVGVGMFQTSVFPLPPGAKRQVSLRYNQLLRKDQRVTDFLFPLATAKYTSEAPSKVSVQASIETTARLKSVYSPTHTIEVKRTDEHHATVRWEVARMAPDSDFRLFFDTAKDDVAASVLSYRPDPKQDGYFVMLASPALKAKNIEPSRKTVIVVVDRSGSMSGKKIEQAKEAMRYVVNNLREGDLFNLVAYDSSVESFRPELQRFDDATRKAALGFIEGVYSGGSTNISGALQASLEMIQDPDQPSFVIFLTDGRPTAGETNESKIAALARQFNEHRARIISLGVGYDVNSRLLDRLTKDHGGRGEYVRPDEDLETYVSRLYRRISEPMMTQVNIDFVMDDRSEQDGPVVNRTYPREVRDLFAGEQVVVVGRYRQPGDITIRIRGQLGDSQRKFTYEGELVKRSRDQSFAFVEKLWAVRRIGEIIDEVDLNGKNDELIEELVKLSTEHGIVTPYTSYLADENDRAGLADSRRARAMAGESLNMLAEAEGAGGFAQRQLKQAFRSAQAPADAFGGGGAGLGGLSGRFPASGARPNAPASSAALGSGRGQTTGPAPAADEESRPTVVSIGSTALYKRGKVWIAANARDVKLKDSGELDADAAKDVTQVKRFSDEYFQLVAENSPQENKILAVQKPDESLLIRLRGKLYQIQ